MNFLNYHSFHTLSFLVGPVIIKRNRIPFALSGNISHPKNMYPVHQDALKLLRDSIIRKMTGNDGATEQRKFQQLSQLMYYKYMST